MIIFVLICTVIGWLCGHPVIGLLVGLLISFAPMMLDEYDRAAARRRRRKRR